MLTHVKMRIWLTMFELFSEVDGGSHWIGTWLSSEAKVGLTYWNRSATHRANSRLLRTDGPSAVIRHRRGIIVIGGRRLRSRVALDGYPDAV